MRATREMTRDVPAAVSELSDDSAGASPSAVLGAGIERDFVSLQRAVELVCSCGASSRSKVVR